MHIKEGSTNSNHICGTLLASGVTKFMQCTVSKAYYNWIFLRCVFLLAHRVFLLAHRARAWIKALS